MPFPKRMAKHTLHVTTLPEQKPQTKVWHNLIEPAAVSKCTPQSPSCLQTNTVTMPVPSVIRFLLLLYLGHSSRAHQSVPMSAMHQPRLCMSLSTGLLDTNTNGLSVQHGAVSYPHSLHHTLNYPPSTYGTLDKMCID